MVVPLMINTAHPRACGANGDTDMHFNQDFGSSPRVRGQLVRAGGERLHGRLIPARAGPTCAIWSMAKRFSAHPRACGANCHLCFLQSLPSGSSPRVRGQPAARRRLRHGQRLIPARAGPTSGRDRSRPVLPAHPRACGANYCCQAVTVTVVGSSPRVRGQRAGGPVRLAFLRLIPARAGPTHLYRTVCPSLSAHPRACGANTTLQAVWALVNGSSPRVRGQLSFCTPL